MLAVDRTVSRATCDGRGSAAGEAGDDGREPVERGLEHRHVGDAEPLTPGDQVVGDLLNAADDSYGNYAHPVGVVGSRRTTGICRVVPAS